MNKDDNKKFPSIIMPQKAYYRETPARDLGENQTLYNTIKNCNKENIDLNAIGYMNHHYTYENLQKEVDVLANAFINIGVKENDVVTIATVSTPEVAKILLALNKIGAVSKWIDLRVKKDDLETYINEHESKYVIVFELLQKELEEVINNTEVKKAIIISPVDSLSIVEKIGYKLKTRLDKTYTKSSNDERFLSFPELFKLGTDRYTVPVGFDKDKPSLIIQSSGTTGKAKSIVHTDFTVNNSVQNFAYHDLPFKVGNRVLVTVPPWIGYGLINSYYLSLALGMEAVLCPKVDKDTVFNALGTFDLSFAAPLHYRYLKEKASECKKLEQVQALISGGDKITAEELRDIKAVLSNYDFTGEIINGYGNNEGLGAETCNPISHNKLGTIGIPLHGMKVCAFDENNNELPFNETGELCVNTNTMFKEYSGNKEETDKIKQLHSDNEYWIHTGDLGKIDEEGFVHIEGRLRRIIIRTAFKIFPGTIESAIKQHYAVKDCVTVGVNDKEDGSVPMAFIVLKEEFISMEDKILSEIKELCLKELKDYENPVYFKVIEEIPYTQNNKQDFRKLENIGNNEVEETNVIKLTKKL